MNNNVSKIYVNKIDKNLNNNKRVYYSIYDDNKPFFVEEKISYFDMQEKINKLFRSSDFIYKKKFVIKTINGEMEYTIISKSYDYLLTINGEKIFIKDIIDIRNG